MSELEQLQGEVARVSYFNEETGFCVLIVKARQHQTPVTIVGETTVVKPGELVNAKGHWVEDARFGRQFRAEELQICPPTSAAGMSRYLASGAIPGVGPKLAERMLRQFGDQLVEILEQQPARLGEVPGIGPKKLQKIIEAWQQSRAVRQIMIFLGEHGISTSRAVRIYRQYGNDAIGIIRKNPYRLANDIWGIGFQTADRLAQRLGVDPQSPQRAAAAVIHVLDTAAHAGHCALPVDSIVSQTRQLTDIEPAVIETALATLADQHQLVAEDLQGEPFGWLPQLYQAEWEIAQSVFRLLRSGRHPLAEIQVEKAIEWVQQRLNIRLATDQAEAVRAATRQRVLVVTGGPGVGKTTIVQSIAEIASAKGLQCVLCAPTGRAAKRLEEATGRPAKTIHRLLEFSPHTGAFQRGPESPLSGHVFIVDESSMLDARLADSFLRALPDHACVVFVGDVDQLPSVGPGNVLADLIRSDTAPVARLRTVFRQGARSQIITAAHAINSGELPTLSPVDSGLADFYFIDATTPEQIRERVIQLVAERIPQRFGVDAIRDVQVIAPMHRSLLGTRQLNADLQSVLNPAEQTIGVERFGARFSKGDRVIQLQNNYDRNVFNGDQGIICDVNRIEETLTVQFDDDRIRYDFHSLDELSLAYAMTVHKSQGSEFPCVVIPLHTQHYLLLQRNLLYTAVTRGRQLVVIVGSRKALELAVRRTDGRRRYSALQHRLQQLAMHPVPHAMPD